MKFSGVIGRAFDLRGQSDYDDFYVIAKADVVEQLQDAAEFFKAAKDFLELS